MSKCVIFGFRVTCCSDPVDVHMRLQRWVPGAENSSDEFSRLQHSKAENPILLFSKFLVYGAGRYDFNLLTPDLLFAYIYNFLGEGGGGRDFVWKKAATR